MSPLGVNVSEEDRSAAAFTRYRAAVRAKLSFLHVLGKRGDTRLEDGYIQLSVCVGEQQTADCVTSDSLLAGDATRAVVLGLPGSGKTTLLQHMAYLCAGPGREVIPIFFRAVEFAQSEEKLEDFILQILRGEIGEDSAKHLAKHPAYGKAQTVVLMDGLDEVAAADYEDIPKRLAEFFRVFPYCRFIITSRVAGFRLDLFAAFALHIVKELGDTDIRDYVDRFCPKEAADRVYGTILNDERLLELARTPFLLAMMCLNYRELGERAVERADLYKRCTRFLLRADDYQTGRPKEAPASVDEMERALKTTAAIFFKLDSPDSFKEEDVLFFVARTAAGTTPANEIIAKVCANSGLLRQAGKDYYFVHRSIWEYFVALGMRDGRVEHVWDRALVPSWEEPIKLYVGLAKEEELEGVLKGIWDRNKGLALRCMNERAKPPEDFARRLYSSLGNRERLAVVTQLREAMGLCSTDLARRRLLRETISNIFKVERSCEVIYECISLLEEDGTPACLALVSQILDLQGADQRRDGYVADPRFKLKFAKLPGGAYTMGSDAGLDPRERPGHTVVISPFDIACFPVTNALYYDKFPFAADRRNPYSDAEDEPVNNVSWYEAVLFARWLGCDLPAEAEWEYACRAAGKDDAVLGDRRRIGSFAWYVKNSHNRTHGVGEKDPNSFGIYDMLGNIREWCKDWHSDTYYGECLRKGNVVDPQGPPVGREKVVRGGCFDWNNRNLRPTYRNFNLPDNEYYVNGFRIVRRAGSDTLRGQA